MEDAVSLMEKAVKADARKREALSQTARKNYQDARESLSQNLNTLESGAEQRMFKSKQSMEQRLLALRDEESANILMFFFVSGLYLILVGSLAMVTYKSFASPIRKL